MGKGRQGMGKGEHERVTAVGRGRFRLGSIRLVADDGILMQYRKLGSSDLNVSVIGLGTMSWIDCRHGVTPDPSVPPDEVGSKEMVAAALESGINFFDTAQSYGRGRAEELLGRALKALGRRDDAIVVTKTGPLFGEEAEGGRSCDLSAKRMRRTCEESLRRLQTDRIDLLLAHWPDPQTPIEETADAAARLRDEGKIRWFGVSNFPNELVASAQKVVPVVANQLPYSMISREIEREQRPFCQANNVGIIAYSPLGKGILSGKYSAEHLPPADDYRHTRPHFSKENLTRNLGVAARLRACAEEWGITPLELALAWSISQPGITCAIPGGKTVEQVRQNARAGTIAASLDLTGLAERILGASFH